MTALLKSGAETMLLRVRAFGAPSRPVADPERERLIEELAALSAALAARDERIAALSKEAEAAFAQGEAEGREAGRREAEDEQDALVAAIKKAADEALARLDGEMRALERLAPLLAETCLERMLLASEARVALVTDLVRGQVGQLQAGAILAIQVSAEDFGTPESLARLNAALADPVCEIAASPTLESGDCTIALRLGTLEIGLGQQWGALRVALGEMAA
jgi:flagellar biosynthesis/type III secretory pathway protein FliH